MKNFIIFAFATSILFAPLKTHALTASFSPSEHLAKQEKPFTTTVVINTEGENINAIEGVLKIDARLAGAVQLSDSGSLITYWIAKPQWDGQQNVVRFSGAIPGGYKGSAGILFSLILPPHDGAPIDNAVTISDFKAYKNDGVGSNTRVTTRNFSLGDIAGQVDTGITDQLYIDGTRKDDIAPEVFSPQISRDENVFNNKWFISFSTVDKQSGIDHYEIQETQSGSIDSGEWKTATSPYELQDQELHSFVYVIAVDRQGNERIIKVFPRNQLSWAQQYGVQVGVIVLVIGIAGVLLYRRRNKKAL